jgi:hypothetical protein
MEVPKELATRNQWVLWRYEGQDNEIKMPRQKNGSAAKANDATTWSNLGELMGAGSLGFVFKADDGLFGIDLDGCIGSDGELADWADQVIRELPTYAEISPSGTGVKLYGCGSLPSWLTKHKVAVNTPPVCDKSPAIEAYDRGRYFAFTGDRLAGAPAELTECPALGSVLSRFFPVAEPAKPALPRSEPVGDIPRRADAYLSRIPGAVSKQGGHNQTFRAACVLVLGFGLTPDEAYPLLANWNLTCVPPWSDRDLWHKLHDANKRDGRRGFLLESGRYEGSDVELQSLLSSLDAPAAALPPPSRQFPAACLRVDGLIGDVMAYNLRTARYPQPELALAGALALMATITGRKVADGAGTRTNCYVLGLAPSGAGKEQARKINKELLLRAGGDSLLGPERIASSAGLVASVHSSPAILFQIDEIGHLLATMKNPAKSPHLFNIGSVLMQLYSSSDTIWKADAYADQKKNKAIDQPHAVVYGTGVPDGFWDNLTAESVKDGLLGRMMCFQSSFGYVPMSDFVNEPTPEDLIERVRAWIQFAPGGNLGTQFPQPYIADYDEDAFDRMTDHLNGICDRRGDEDPTSAAVWSRSGEKTSKLALLFACSRGAPGAVCVSFEDVDRAVKISNWLTRQMLHKASEHVSENEVESRAKKVLRLIEGEMNMSQLSRRTQWLRGKERTEILSDLAQSGYITIETKESTGGRKATIVTRKFAETNV